MRAFVCVRGCAHTWGQRTGVPRRRCRRCTSGHPRAAGLKSIQLELEPRVVDARVGRKLDCDARRIGAEGWRQVPPTKVAGWSVCSLRYEHEVAICLGAEGLENRSDGPRRLDEPDALYAVRV